MRTQQIDHEYIIINYLFREKMQKHLNFEKYYELYGFFMNKNVKN